MPVSSVMRGVRRPELQVTAAAIIGLAVACALYAAFSRGIWLDEFWSLRLGDPEISFGDALNERWLRDTNPVSANLLYRIVGETGARDIFALRLILNLPAALLLFAGSAALWRSSPTRDPFYIVLPMLVAGLPAFVSTFADFRIYLWQLCSTALALQAGYRIVVEPTATRSGVVIGLATTALIAALILHFVAGLLVAIFAGTFAMYLARRRRWRAVGAIALPAAIAGSAMLVLAAVQYVHVSRALAQSWIETTTLGAILMMAGAASAALLANPGATAVALVASRAGTGSRRRYVLLLVVAIAVGGALLLLVNAVRPVVVDRYLLPWQPAVCAILAASISGAIGCGWRLYAVAACCVLSIAITTVRQSRETGWNGTRDFVAATVHACPATRVHAISPWRLRSSRDSRAAALEAPVFEDAYRRLATDAGFAVTIVPDAVRVLDLPVACASLLWIEHSGGVRLGDAASLFRDARIGLTGPARVSRFATADGVVLIAERVTR